MRLFFISGSEKLKMFIRGFMLCIVLFSVSLVNCLNLNENDEDFHSNTTSNSSQITWKMMPDNKGIIVSAVLYNVIPTQKLSTQQVKFLLWNRKNRDHPEKVTFNGKDVPFEQFNSRLKTVFLIHGFTDTIGKNLFFNVLKNAFLRQGNYNVIGINWVNLATTPWYGQAVKNSVIVGRETGKLIMALRSLESEDRPIKMHLVAHNIGTLVAGVAASMVKGRKIEKIMGLDPPYILTNTLPRDRKLDKGDAEVVEILHTSGDYIGVGESAGHRDFYPNGGKWPQPGCTLDIADKCSIRRAFLYYGEAVASRDSFMATQCENYVMYLGQYCRNNPSINLFNDEPATFTGNFYLMTNSQEPFLSF